MGIGWEPPGSVADPYVGFSELRPLFEVESTRTRFQISANRFPLFCADEFLVDKPEDEFRIFCVGGSTVQGRPFAIETSFSTWLELRLKAVDPAKQWNAINCGGVSYASYRLAPIIEEIVDYQPDLIVLYTGHNEFLEDRTYARVKTTSPWIARTHERLAKIRTYSLLRSLVVDEKSEGAAETLSSDVEARLDFRDGLSVYHRDDQWKRDVTNHFEHNLRRMLRAVTDNGIPIIVCQPVANLADASPFKSQSGASLSDEETTKFDKVWQTIKSSRPITDWTAEIERLQQQVQLNPRHAELQFRMGQAYHQAGNVELAKPHLLAAKEEDVCPLRIIEPVRDSIERVSQEFGAPLVNVNAFFESRAAGGIVGSESMVDHVHPSIHGHQLIAELLESEMVKMRMVSHDRESEKAIEVVFKAHFESLPNMYFELGKDRLAGLKRWAEGKVTREKSE